MEAINEILSGEKPVDEEMGIFGGIRMRGGRGGRGGRFMRGGRRGRGGNY